MKKYIRLRLKRITPPLGVRGINRLMMRFIDRRAIILPVAVIMLGTLVFMSAFEIGKTALLPHLTLVQSHILSVVSLTLLVTVVSFVVMIKIQRLVFQNITVVEKRLQTEETLRKSQDRYKTLIQNINEYIYSVSYIDGVAVTTYHSPKCLAITGYAPEEYYADPDLWYTMIHPDDRARVLDFTERILAEALPAIEHRIIHKDGTERWISNNSAVKRDDAGNVLQVNGFIQDITERKAAERALQESERRYRLLAENIGDVIWTMDENLKRLYVSPSIRQLRGISVEEAMSESLDKIIAPEHLPGMRKRLAALMPDIKRGADIKPMTVEMEVLHKNGARIPVEMIVSVVYDEDRNFAYFLGVSRDITERRKAQRELQQYREHLEDLVRERTRELMTTNARLASEVEERKKIEEELRRSDLRHRTFLEASTDAIFLETLEGAILDCNTAATKIYGYTKDEFLDLTVLDLVPLEIRDEIPRVIAAEIKARRFSIEAHNVRKNGEVFPCEVNTRVVKMEGAELVAVFVRDITERRRAEAAQRRELEVNTALAATYAILVSPESSIRDITSVILKQALALTESAHGFVSEIDPESGENIGHTLTDMLGDQCGMSFEGEQVVFHPRPDGTYPGLWGVPLNARRPFVSNDPIGHPASTGLPDGHIPISRFLSVPVMLGERLVGQISLANAARPYGDDDVDAITRLAEFYALAVQRWRVEERIKSLNESLTRNIIQIETANKELEAFSYTVSHDLRAPLLTIGGYSKLLLKRYRQNLDEEAQKFLNIITTDSLRLEKMMEELLTLSRMGYKQLELTDIDMTELARSVIGELERTSRNANTRIVVKALPMSRGDLLMIRQVFVNLLSNSIKYTRPAKEPLIEIDGWTENGENVYRVRDNGVGFDMKQVDKLFSVFQRLHGQEEFEGTGVGLSIVQRIVLQHGGRVWGEGKRNRGATFCFTLPVVSTI